MTLNIAKHEISRGIEGGVYYFNLSDFPSISTDELKLIIAFIQYEKANNRVTEIICDNEQLLQIIKNAVSNPETVDKIRLSETADFVYHGTSIYSAKKILTSGKLLSAARVYGKTGEELAYEKRESLWNDPADFFEYIMFCNGDDMTGDYVVLSEKFPNEVDFENGNFDAGIRFYFRSDEITRHPGHVFDGYHPVKVRDEILLSEYLFACIVPEQYKESISDIVLPELLPKVHCLKQIGMKLYEWNDKVYSFIKSI